MPANDSDGQKRYERFIELVKAAYVGSLKTENIYKNGQDLWRKVRHDPDKYQQVVNDLKSRPAKQKQSTITFWGKAASKHWSTLDAQNSAAGESTTEIFYSKDIEEIFDSKDKEQISGSKDTEQIPPTKVVVMDEEEEGSEGESFHIFLSFIFVYDSMSLSFLSDCC